MEFEEKQWHSLQVLGYIGILQLLRIMFTEMYCRIPPIAVLVLHVKTIKLDEITFTNSREEPGFGAWRFEKAEPVFEGKKIEWKINQLQKMQPNPAKEIAVM